MIARCFYGGLDDVIYNFWYGGIFGGGRESPGDRLGFDFGADGTIRALVLADNRRGHGVSCRGLVRQ